MHKMEYKLKFLLNSQTLKVMNIVEKTNDERLRDFNNNYNGCKMIQAFCSKIEPITKFPLLNVPYNKNSISHTVLYCQVAVGNSLFVSSNYVENLDITSGFDSLMFSNNDSPSSKSSKNLCISGTEYLVDQEVQIKDYMYAVKRLKKNSPTL